MILDLNAENFLTGAELRKMIGAKITLADVGGPSGMWPGFSQWQIHGVAREDDRCGDVVIFVRKICSPKTYAYQLAEWALSDKDPGRVVLDGWYYPAKPIGRFYPMLGCTEDYQEQIEKLPRMVSQTNLKKKKKKVPEFVLARGEAFRRSEAERLLRAWKQAPLGNHADLLFDLIAKSDTQNRKKLHQAYPDEVEAFERFRNGKIEL